MKSEGEDGGDRHQMAGIVGQNSTGHLTNSSVKCAKIDIKMVIISSYFDKDL